MAPPKIRYGLLIPLWLLQLTLAHADPAALTLDEPETSLQSGIHRLQVSDDGTARLHLKAENGASATTAELLVTPFKADSQPPAAVGFDGGVAGAPLLPYLRNVVIAAAGSEVRLAAPTLRPNIEYSGKLSATAAHHTFVWDITLIRPGVLPPFVCRGDVLTVAADGSAALELQRAAPFTGRSMTLRVSPFVSKDQELGDVALLIDPTKRIGQTEWPAFPTSGNGSLQVPLRALGLAEGSAYTGHLFFLDGANEIAQCELTLQMPKLPRGDLTINTQSLTRTLTQSFTGDTPSEPITVVLSDKTRTHRLDGIAVAADGISEAPNGSFDAGRDLRFSVDGTVVQSFTALRMPLAAKDLELRTIPPGGQMAVGMELVAPGAGKYSFSLRFSAVNASSPTPNVDVVINVREHVMRAVLAMFGALLLSFFLTKGIANWRERARILARVAELKQRTFGDHSCLPTAVFMRAVLAQTSRLLKPVWFMSPPQSVYDYMARAERSASVLGSYAALQEALKALTVPEAKPHYDDAIDTVMQRIGPLPLDQKTADAVISDLGVIAATLSDPLTWYWAILKSKAKILLHEAQWLVGGPGDPGVINELIAILTTPPPDADSKYDGSYWIVKLLLSHRMFSEDLAALTTAYTKRKNRGDVFKEGDLLAWQRLTDEIKAKHIRIASVDPAETLESLQPIQLFIDLQDRSLGDSYLVRNILEYTWSFELTESPKRFGKPAHRKWSETLKGARVTQFMPFAGELKVHVKIRWPGAHDGIKAQELELTAEPLRFADNSELDLLKNLSFSDTVLLALVFGITLVTGLPTLYFAKAGFGSFSDYVAICAWAIGIDQGKNLIQLLKSFPADTPSANP